MLTPNVQRTLEIGTQALCHFGLERREEHMLVRRSSAIDITRDRAGHPVERSVHTQRSGHAHAD
jgi:hypothetical protein